MELILGGSILPGTNSNSNKMYPTKKILLLIGICCSLTNFFHPPIALAA
jgi:hypothetical protein